jgi:hypothetical protein
MAEAVIDRLEAVKVEHDHRAGPAMPPRRGHCAQRAGDEAAPVGQAGQRVGLGQHGKLGLQAVIAAPVFELQQEEGRHQHDERSPGPFGEARRRYLAFRQHRGEIEDGQHDDAEQQRGADEAQPAPPAIPPHRQGAHDAIGEGGDREDRRHRSQQDVQRYFPAHAHCSPMSRPDTRGRNGWDFVIADG